MHINYYIYLSMYIWPDYWAVYLRYHGYVEYQLCVVGVVFRMFDKMFFDEMLQMCMKIINH